MEEPLNIAICEDSKADEEKLLAILSACSIPNHPVVFRSGEALLDAYRPFTYDLLLSDIYMGGMTGVETVTKLRQSDPEIPVAFVTTSAEFALESYRLSALKYIEKPYREQEIEDILLLAKMKRDSAPSLFVQCSGKEERVRYSQILYLEQQTHHLLIMKRDGETVTIYEKLSLILPKLETYGFFSPHKSFAVNLNYVCNVDPELKCFVMPNGKNIPIRRETMTKAKKAFQDNLFRRAREGQP